MINSRLSAGTSRPAGRRLFQAFLMLFAVVAGLGTAAALSGEFDRAPLLLWIAIGYVALLAVDTQYAVKGF